MNNDTSISMLKAKENMGVYNCNFYIIKEVEPGLILIGGSAGCDVRCAWKYIEDDQPICYYINFTDYISNFFRICN